MRKVTWLPYHRAEPIIPTLMGRVMAGSAQDDAVFNAIRPEQLDMPDVVCLDPLAVWMLPPTHVSESRNRCSATCAKVALAF